MVDLKQTLSRFLSIPGVWQAILVGRDGLMIEGLTRDGKDDMEAVGAIMTTGLSTAEALGLEISRGSVIGVLMEYENGLAFISTALNKLMNDTNATSVMLIDKSGQVIATQGTGVRRNATSLGALLAGAFSSSRHIAELLGEKDFRTIFQQGVKENIFTTMVEEQWLLVIVFDKLTHIGLVKVLSKKASDEMGRILERVRADTSRTKSSVINVQFRSSVEDTIDLLFRD